MARPDLDVWVVGGDGDVLSIGGNHLIHALRRNVNLTILLFNNQIYGLTKGQYSPTSEVGKVTKSTPFGSLDQPFNPVSLALGAEATFVARTHDMDRQHMMEMFRRAHDHKGAAFVEIYQNCNVFNDGAFEGITSQGEPRRRCSSRSSTASRSASAPTASKGVVARRPGSAPASSTWPTSARTPSSSTTRPARSPGWPSCCPGCRPARPSRRRSACSGPSSGPTTAPRPTGSWPPRRSTGPADLAGPAALPPDLAGLTVARTRGRHQAPPAWWSDAKLGIFVHWTPASVAGWAPTDHEIGDLLASGSPTTWRGRRTRSGTRTPCATRTARWPGTTATHWGDRPYEASPPTSRPALEQWDPQAWAERFRDAGARYVVLVAKHHDGFCLWPTGVREPAPAGLALAARRGRRAGRGRPRAWACASASTTRAGSTGPSSARPVGSTAEVAASIPQGAYPAYAEAHVRELIERYRPSVLWNDIAWPGRLATFVPLSTTTGRRCPTGW